MISSYTKVADGGSVGHVPAAPSSAVLTIAGVAKTYVSSSGDGTVALEPVDAVMREGEFVSLVGPSGCGKTTLLKLCAGLISPTAGRVTFRDTNEVVRPGTFGMVFQSPALLQWRTVLQNVLLPADLLRLARSEARTRALELLDLVQLGGWDAKYPGELSGGMQQRAAIARALLHDPDILFMDEPFGALDAMTREELNMELQRIQLAQQKTILFVTHSIQEATLLSDRVLVLSRSPGRVAADIDIPLPRPRTVEIQLSNEFREIEAMIRDMLNRHPAHPNEGSGT